PTELGRAARKLSTMVIQAVSGRVQVTQRARPSYDWIAAARRPLIVHEFAASRQASRPEIVGPGRGFGRGRRPVSSMAVWWLGAGPLHPPWLSEESVSSMSANRLAWIGVGVVVVVVGGLVVRNLRTDHTIRTAEVSHEETTPSDVTNGGDR